MWTTYDEIAMWFLFFCPSFVSVYATLGISVIYKYKEWNVLQKIVGSLICILGSAAFCRIAFYLFMVEIPTWVWANVGVLLCYSWFLYDLAFKRSTWTKTERKAFIIIWCIVMLFVCGLVAFGSIGGYFSGGGECFEDSF